MNVLEVAATCQDLARLMPAVRRALVPSGTGEGGGAHGVPASKPPVPLDVLADVIQIEAGILSLENLTRRALGHVTISERHEQAVTAALAILPDLLCALPAEHAIAEAAGRELDRIHRIAQRVARETDPPVTLEEPCPHCGGRLQRGASLADGVWCAGHPRQVGDDLELVCPVRPDTVWCTRHERYHRLACAACGRWHGGCLDPRSHRPRRWNRAEFHQLRVRVFMSRSAR